MKTSYCQYATNNRPSMLTMQSMISLWCYLVQQAPTSVISHRHLYSFNKNLRHSSWSWRALSWVGCEPVASPVNTQWLKRLATLTVDLNIHYVNHELSVNPTNISHQYKTPAHYAARHLQHKIISSTPCQRCRHHSRYRTINISKKPFLCGGFANP